jgi:hypothetical protein
VNVRFPIIVATALCAAACATTQTKDQAAPAREEVRFNGYRLVVERDDAPSAGTLAEAPGTNALSAAAATRRGPTARAFDPKGKEVPVVTVPLSDVKVCAPRPTDPSAGSSPVCEPLVNLPKRTSFKTGTGSICWYYDAWGKIHYYQCPTVAP